MAHPLPKYKTTAFRPIVDDEHLVGRELHIVASLMIKNISPRGIAHAHRDVMFAGRQNKALVNTRWSIAGDTSRRKAGLIDVVAVDIELHLDWPPDTRTILHPAHIGCQLRY